MKKHKAKTKQELEKMLDNAWFGVDLTDDELFDPMSQICGASSDSFLTRFTYLMGDPDYFYFVCKYILNVEIMPIQSVILKELWDRKSPMLIGSRGLSKSFCLALYCMLRMLLMPGRKLVIVGAAFRQSKVVFEYMEGIWNNAPVLRDLCYGANSGPKKETDRFVMSIQGGQTLCLPLGTGNTIRGARAHDIIAEELACLESSTLIQTDRGLVEIGKYFDYDTNSLINIDNELEVPDKFFKTPLTDVYKITTVNGYSFSCSNIHQTLTRDGFKLAKDLTTDDYLELDFNDYFPTSYIKHEDLVVDEKLAWLMGVLVSEGTVTNRNYINISNTDRRLIDYVKLNFSEYSWSEYHKDAYKDSRGWDCKDAWDIRYSNTEFRDKLYKLGIDYVTSHNKVIPWSILQSPRSVVISFLSGLFEGDGSAFRYTHREAKNIGVTYYSVNKKLIDQLQVLFLKFKILGGSCSRKSKISTNPGWMLAMRGINAKKIIDLLDVIKWKDKFSELEMAYLEKKPQITKNRERYVVTTYKGNKAVYIGSFATEEECNFAFKAYWDGAREVVRVKSVELLSEKDRLYDFYLPKTHSFIGNGFVQHNSIPIDIFENVVGGFAAVSASPVDKVKLFAKKELAKRYGVELVEHNNDFNKTNQIILCGTASYEWNHFCKYWKRYKGIVESKGDMEKLTQHLGYIPSKDFNWKDYSIIRIPVELAPPGLMDAGIIERAKATVSSGIYMHEYGACHSRDSMGFFKRSLIDGCTLSLDNPITLPSGDIMFVPMNKGNSNGKYVIAVDPASEVDNFSIVVLEIFSDHRRVVYCWTTNRQKHRNLMKSGMTHEDDFYGYCARKIRDLMAVFPTVEVAIDGQGGGIAVIEALHDRTKLLDGELQMWPKIIEGKEQSTDDFGGLHIIEVCQFGRYEWVSEANHGLRKDLEDKVLIFPFFDSATIGMAEMRDIDEGRIYDTNEDCIMEIEELKNELSMIVVTESPNGRARWDTPDGKSNNKKNKIRKDRYSALVMANMSARQIKFNVQPKYTGVRAGFAGRITDKENGPLYVCPQWWEGAYK